VDTTQPVAMAHHLFFQDKVPLRGGGISQGMSRLLDRILTSCHRFLPSMIITDETMMLDQLRPVAAKDGISESELLARIRKNEPLAIREAPLAELERLPVIAAEDVAQYVYGLENRTEMSDVVGSLAPPFDQFFIEFQRVPNRGLAGLHAWGAHFKALSDENEIKACRLPHYKPQKLIGDLYDHFRPRWVLKIDVYMEVHKGKPFGPAAQFLCGLAEDGTWIEVGREKSFWVGGMVEMSHEPLKGKASKEDLEMEDRVAQLLFPALMAISFMHCKNVTLESVMPSEKLSRSYCKRHGRPLVSYGELRIDPIRKLLEQQRRGVGGSLRKALHLCRGHFKTFTADAPLMGHAAGTYFWAPQVRGAKSEGVVIKDYRVEAPSKVGRAYSDANENPPNAEQEAPRSKDPDSVGRGLAAHNRTQNYLANAIRDIGWLARSPSSSEPQYDLAWLANDMLYVCEVKSLTTDNEERQLRMATGQVIRYRQQLTAKGHEPCFAVICAERQPSDTSWGELCEREGIILIWPEVAVARLKEAHTRRLN
jgi:hypothetical protein